MICENCEQYFVPTVTRNQLYCPECINVTKECKACGEKFTSKRVHNKKYCSPKCAMHRFSKDKN